MLEIRVTILLLCSALLGWFGATVVRRHAGRLGLVSIPNNRSSHAQPTPHGGGLGIVLAGSLVGLWLSWGEESLTGWIVGFALLLATVGLIDDIRHLPARYRFLVQVGVCGGFLMLLGHPPWNIISTTADSAWAAWALSGLLLVAGVWWINLFNFMDGIDGIAGTQAVFMLLAGAGLSAGFHPAAPESAMWNWMLAIAAAAIGFLFVNWPPARIFMGDVGSTYLAYMIFAFALLTVRAGWLSYASWLILGAVFIMDATITLLRRVLTGERWFEAHRSHAYQRLARRFGAHQPVTLIVVAINVVWLLPLAASSLLWPQTEWLCTILAYAPLTIAAGWLGTGIKEHG